MNISLKTPFISLVFLFLMGCDSVQSVQKENPLVNALFKNGIDISNDIDRALDNQSIILSTSAITSLPMPSPGKTRIFLLLI